MKRSEAFPSKYMSKDDVKVPVRATIAAVRFDVLKGENGDEQKPVMYFQGDVKPMIVNNTNWMTCEDAWGDDSDNWLGKSVELYFEPSVMFGGKRVGGVRVRISASGKTQAAAPAMTTQQAGEVKTPKGKRVADLTADEVVWIREHVGAEQPLRQAVETWMASV